MHTQRDIDTNTSDSIYVVDTANQMHEVQPFKWIASQDKDHIPDEEQHKYQLEVTLHYKPPIRQLTKVVIGQLEMFQYKT